MLLVALEEGGAQNLSRFVAGQGVNVVEADRDLVGEQVLAAQLFEVR